MRGEARGGLSRGSPSSSRNLYRWLLEARGVVTDRTATPVSTRRDPSSFIPIDEALPIARHDGRGPRRLAPTEADSSASATWGTDDTIVFSTGTVEVLSLETNVRRTLLHGSPFASYLPTGHVIFLRAGTLMAVRIDPDTLELVGARWRC